MPEFTPRGCAFNHTRQVFLATTLALADTHWPQLEPLSGIKLKLRSKSVVKHQPGD
jgi:hypothetical protein